MTCHSLGVVVVAVADMAPSKARYFGWKARYFGWRILKPNSQHKGTAPLRGYERGSSLMIGTHWVPVVS